MSDKFEAMKAKMAAMRSSSRSSLKRGEVSKVKATGSEPATPPESQSIAESIVSPRLPPPAADASPDAAAAAAAAADGDDDFSSVFSITSPRGQPTSASVAASAGVGAGGSGPNGEMTKKDKMKARSSLKKLEAMKLKVALMRGEKGDGGGGDEAVSRKNARKSLPMAWQSEVKKEDRSAQRASVKFPLTSLDPPSPSATDAAEGDEKASSRPGSEIRDGGGDRSPRNALSPRGSRIEGGSANDRVEAMKAKMAMAKNRTAFVPKKRDDSTGRSSIRLSSSRGGDGESSGLSASAPAGDAERKSGSRIGEGEGGTKMALAANKFQEMKKRTEERRRRKEQQKKIREGKRKALGSQLESFLSIVTNLEPMLKKLEAEKEAREAEMREAQREMKLMRQAATASQSNISLLSASMDSLLSQDRDTVSIDYIFRELEGMRATLGAVSGVYDQSLHAEPTSRGRGQSVADIVKARKRQRSVCADAPPPAASLAPPPPPMPSMGGPPPPLPPKMKAPSKLRLPDEVRVSPPSESASASRGDLLAQIRKTALRKLDMDAVAEERAAASTDKEGALFSSLAETVKMALDIRKKAMEANESDEEDWSDEDDMDDWDGE